MVSSASSGCISHQSIRTWSCCSDIPSSITLYQETASNRRAFMKFTTIYLVLILAVFYECSQYATRDTHTPSALGGSLPMLYRRFLWAFILTPHDYFAVERVFTGVVAVYPLLLGSSPLRRRVRELETIGRGKDCFDWDTHRFACQTQLYFHHLCFQYKILSSKVIQPLDVREVVVGQLR